MLRPLHNYLLLQVIENESGKEGRKRIPKGKVIAVSPKVDIAIDSIVIFSRNCGEFVNYHSCIYLLIDYQHILAILE